MFLPCHFSDSLGNVYNYEPIASIVSIGTVNRRGDSFGHYFCDVKPATISRWIQTSDNETHKVLDESEVSSQSYMI